MREMSAAADGLPEVVSQRADISSTRADDPSPDSPLVQDLGFEGADMDVAGFPYNLLASSRIFVQWLACELYRAEHRRDLLNESLKPGKSRIDSPVKGNRDFGFGDDVAFPVERRCCDPECDLGHVLLRLQGQVLQ